MIITMGPLLFMLALGAADATDKDFKIVTDGTTAKIKAGQPGKLHVQVVAQNGYKVSDESPFTLKLTAPEGVKLDGDKFGRKDLVDPKAKDPTVKTGFVASKKGEQEITGDLTFFLCTEKLCQRMQAKHTVKVVVE